MEICDIINETDDGPKDAMKAIKKRIVGNKNFREVMLALTILETCVKNCGHRFHVLVCTREFVEGVLVRTILPKNNPPTVLHDRVLGLIQGWADAFRNKPTLSGVVSVYDDLKRRGLEFPMTDLDAMSPIHTPIRSAPEDASYPTASGHLSPHTGQETNGAPVPISAEQKEKLRAELDLVKGNLQVMTDLLNQSKPGEISPSDSDLLQRLYIVGKTMQHRVADLIPGLCDEELIGELLVINDDLNSALTRYESFQELSGTQSTAPPSEPVNLLDFSTPILANQTSAEPVSQTEQDPTSSQIKSSGEEDEFDMFAQTRGSSLAEQRKSVRYEDPGAVEGLAGALDSRLQVTSGTPAPQSSVMDDIQMWLSKEPYYEDDDDDEGLISEDFNKYLAARAKAVEDLPSAPSGPRESAPDQLFSL